MKKDPYFKFLVVVILAGVVLALVKPATTNAVPTGPSKVAVTLTPSQTNKS